MIGNLGSKIGERAGGGKVEMIDQKEVGDLQEKEMKFIN